MFDKLKCPHCKNKSLEIIFDLEHNETSEITCSECGAEIEVKATYRTKVIKLPEEPDIFAEVEWEPYEATEEEKSKEFYVTARGVVQMEKYINNHFLSTMCECVTINDGRKVFTSKGYETFKALGNTLNEEVVATGVSS